MIVVIKAIITASKAVIASKLKKLRKNRKISSMIHVGRRITTNAEKKNITNIPEIEAKNKQVFDNIASNQAITRLYCI